jgi:hypothetical protein
MKVFLCVLCALCGSILAQEDVTRRSFTGVDRVDIDNIDGPVTITAHSGSDVRLVARRTAKADSAEERQKADQEVKLDISQSGGTLRVYVDTPDRCDCGDGRGYSRGRDRGYNVRYDFELEVPARTATKVRTINHAQIKLSGTSGDYDLKAINGGIEMTDVGGSGKVDALNGGVKATFKTNPTAESLFKSLNGVVELAFQPNLNANLQLKTFNGGVYTDFEVSALPITPASAERKNGKFVYRSNRFQGMKVGAGGPEIKVDAFNGDIRILRRSQ